MPAGGPGLPPASPSSEECPSLASCGDLVPIDTEMAAGLDPPRTAFLWFPPALCGVLLEPSRAAVGQLLLRNLPSLSRPV